MKIYNHQNIQPISLMDTLKWSKFLAGGFSHHVGEGKINEQFYVAIGGTDRDLKIIRRIIPLNRSDT